jgi:hypothetical protein
VKVTFYPKSLLLAVAFLVMFGATLDLAITVQEGVAMAGVLGVLAYLLVELVQLGVLVNPAAWRRVWPGGNVAAARQEVPPEL